MIHRRRLVVASLAACLALTPFAARVSAQTAPILSSMDRFHPVVAASGMVVSQEEHATRVGVEILKRGGNAVDAAVAVGFALAVTLPRAGNLGGGGFMLLHLADSGETLALDYREIAPAGAFRDMFLDADGNADPQKSRYSGLAVGVPGTVAGLAAAKARFGSDAVSFADLVAPAIALARDGFAVSDDLAWSLEQAKDRLERDPQARATFYKPDGGLYRPGDILKQPALAATLQAIAEQGADAFYKGPIAEAIAETVQAAGGSMTTQDLSGYEAVWREPITGDYRGYTILSMPPPSSGGVHVVEILNMLESFDLSKSGAGSAETIHVMAEAMKRAYADRSEFLGDPDFVDVPVNALTDKAYAAKRMADFSPERATPAASVKPGDPFPPESDQTTHFSVMDSAGNAVANTYTLNFSYGVGLMAGDTGVLLNNELDDFSAKPGVPNAYGLVGGDANAVAPRKRPLSSMSPTIVLKDGKPFLVTGSPGGSRIISTVVQMLVNVIDHGMNVAEATAAPRMHHQWLPDELRVEDGLSPDTLRLLRDKGHAVEVGSTSGSTQSIQVVEGVLAGASDPRQQGTLAAGH